ARVSRVERERAVRAVATFVGAQMGQLPLRLQAGYGAGLIVFRAVTRARYARGFCELPEPLRRAWFERWAYGRVALGRQLFRAVRSTALLAWYEQPAGRAALDEARAVVASAAAEASR